MNPCDLVDVEPEELDIPPCAVNAECRFPTDVILQSSDGVRYGAHSTYLEIYSGGFPPATSTKATGEIVQMPETGAVLKLLLQYMHNDRQPDSGKIEFEVLSPLAEAVEKYMVFSAMEVCKIRMQQAIPHHPVEILYYSLKHDYPELAKVALPLTISASFHDVNAAMKDRPDITLKWTEYREHWLDIFRFIYEKPAKGSLHKGGYVDCELWHVFHRETIQGVAGRLERVKEFCSILDSNSSHIEACKHCMSRALSWRRAVQSRVEGVPVFDSLDGPLVAAEPVGLWWA